MKVLNTLADRMLGAFVPKVTAAARHCPPGSGWVRTQCRSCGGGGTQCRHQCCDLTGQCGPWSPWSPCVN
jgi:hypothetical protein